MPETTQLRESPSQPKPRLGDYFAGDECNWWLLAKRARRLNATEQRTFHMGESFFVSSNLGPPIMELTFADFAVASDAFAFGAIKYSVGGWRNVSSDDHMQGAGRHFKAWLDDPQSKDDESGLLHEAHFLARAIMCLEQRRMGK